MPTKDGSVDLKIPAKFTQAKIHRITFELSNQTKTGEEFEKDISSSRGI